MKNVRISKNLAFPLSVVTEAIGIIAKRRVGKSYLLAVLVEMLWAAQQQIVILDPKGDWWGLRSSADGKSEGLPILILGGEHGDIQLEPGAGEMVARMVVEEGISVLIDLSGFSKGEVARFCADFLETLYRMKAKEKYRTAMMLVIDEADAIAPQKPQRGEERMLGAANDIVRRGGQRGIGVAMATQRAAVLNKNVLTQVQILIALRLIAPQDYNALEEWIKMHGTEEQKKELMASLAALPVGVAWIWSPGWPDEEGIFKRVEVAQRWTFDSGATPKPGERRIQPKTLADVDLAAVQKQMAAVLERSKQNDPKELKKEIERLKVENRKLASAKPATAAPRPVAVTPQKVVQLQPLKAKDMARFHRSALAIDGATTRALTLAEILRRITVDIQKEVARVTSQAQSVKLQPKLQPLNPAHFARTAPTTVPPAPKRAETRIQVFPPDVADGKPLVGGERRILGVLADHTPLVLTKAMVGSLAKLASSGGTFGTYFSRLKKNEYLVEDSDEGLTITDAGLAVIGRERRDSPPDLEARIEMWRGVLVKGARALFDEVLRTGGIAKTELGRVTNYEASGGTFGTYLSILRRNDLVKVVDGQNDEDMVLPGKAVS